MTTIQSLEDALASMIGEAECMGKELDSHKSIVATLPDWDEIKAARASLAAYRGEQAERARPLSPEFVKSRLPSIRPGYQGACYQGIFGRIEWSDGSEGFVLWICTDQVEWIKLSQGQLLDLISALGIPAEPVRKSE